MRPWQVWLIFVLSLAVVFTAMGWISHLALRSEEAQVRGQARSDFEEDVRLALWRMDSYLANIVSQETARPYFTYSSFFPVEQSYGFMCKDLGPEEGKFLMPSPLLTDTPPHVRLHFQFADDGTWTSPQIPEQKLAAMIDPAFLPEEETARNTANSDQFLSKFSHEQLAAAAPQFEAAPSDSPPMLMADARDWNRGQEWEDNGSRLNPAAQTQRGQAEFRIRRENYESQVMQQAANPPGGVFNSLSNLAHVEGLRAGPMTPHWLGQELFLLRRISAAGTEYVQGAWLDWSFIEGELREKVSDLFPAATFAAAPIVDDADETLQNRLLAALPVRFDAGTLYAAEFDPLSATRITLYIAWACVLLAAGAVAVLLFGVVRLSERRAAFVSSVTHELRTPLTTFRMYAEMLAEGMVPEEQRRKEYLNTLRSESGRLSHLVENVLGYAKLERGGPVRRGVEEVPLADLIEQTGSRLRERAEQAGLELQVQADADAGVSVRCDPSVVEQILFNLVDNACKYAWNSSPKVLTLEAAVEKGCALLRVRDHGPGVAPEVRKRLFRPFSKSARDAAHSAPGVGLGLALSRRLARAMNGNLSYASADGGGAQFELTLPVAGGRN